MKNGVGDLFDEKMHYDESVINADIELQVTRVIIQLTLPLNLAQPMMLTTCTSHLQCTYKL